MSALQDESAQKQGLKTVVCSFVQDAKRFVQDELWDRDLAGLPRMKRLAFSVCRIGTIVVKGFRSDQCALQASALTYITLMSMVPVLALMLSVSKGMGAQEKLMDVIGMKKQVEEVVDGKKVAEVRFEVVENGKLSELNKAAPQMVQVVLHLFRAVENTNFGTLGAIGLCLLVWTVLKAMGRVERSLNMIWGVKTARSFFRKFSDYISILVVVPILILAATSINTMINAMLSSPKLLGQLQQISGPLYWLYMRGMRLSGLVVILLAFSFLYVFMPNTRVRAFPALVGGAVAGIVWYLAQWGYIEVQIGVTKNNAIYGTFAAIPFFLFWLYINWIIVLLGAEISFAVQHYRTYEEEGSATQVSLAVREMLGLVVTYEACSSFHHGADAWSAAEFGRVNDVPTRLLNDVTFTLCNHDVLLPVAGREACYVPGKDIGRLCVADVEAAFRGGNDPYMARIPRTGRERIREAFETRYQAFADDLAKITFRNVLEQTSA